MIKDDIDKTIEKYYEVYSKIKQLENYKSELYKDLTDLTKQFWEENEDSLPIKYAVVYHDSIATSLESYLNRVFPDWDVIDIGEESDTSYGVFMRKKPEYYDTTFENDKYKYSRSIVNPAPKIDMERLKNEYPEMFADIAKLKTTYEIDDARLQKHLEQHPEHTQVLDQYNTAGLPSSRIRVSKKK